MNEYKYEHPSGRKDMTYILGSKCKDGVVLVGDKKVTLDDGTLVGYQEKIFKRAEIIIWGTAGTQSLYTSFNNRLVQYFTSRGLSQINQEEFLIAVEDTFEAMTRISQRYEYDLRSGNLQILIASRFGAWSTLHFVGGLGASTPIMRYHVIGRGEPYGSIFLKKLWKESMNMKQVAELAYFIIKYIQKEQLDNSVGVNSSPPNDKPQVWFIPHNPPNATENMIREANEEELQIMETKSEAMLQKLRVSLGDLASSH